MATILVIDDEAEIRDLITRVLVLEGHRVDTAVNGALALEALQARAYDLVICNIRMPVMDGPTLYARVLEQDSALAARFIFCTGDIVSPDVGAFLMSTDRAALIKPFSIAGLRETVHGALSANRRPIVAALPDERGLVASRYPA